MTQAEQRWRVIERGFAAVAPIEPVTVAVGHDATGRRAIVSQLLHGEQATGAACLVLAGLVSPGPARRCLLLQAEDETRHAAAYRTYLSSLGGPLPPATRAVDAVRAAATWPGPPAAGPLIANLIIESEAVRLQVRDLRSLACPALERMHARIAVDEARHVALARLLLTDALAPVGRRDRAVLWRHAQDLWWTCAEVAHEGYVPARIRRLGRPWLMARWHRVARELAAVGLNAP